MAVGVNIEGAVPISVQGMADANTLALDLCLVRGIYAFYVSEKLPHVSAKHWGLWTGAVVPGHRGSDISNVPGHAHSYGRRVVLSVLPREADGQ